MTCVFRFKCLSQNLPKNSRQKTAARTSLLGQFRCFSLDCAAGCHFLMLCQTSWTTSRGAGWWGNGNSLAERFQGSGTVDGWEIRLYNHLRLVVYPIIYRVSYMLGGCLGFLPSTVSPPPKKLNILWAFSHGVFDGWEMKFPYPKGGDFFRFPAVRFKGSTRWWFQIFFIFIPIWGRWSILTNIFQLGWNHQPEYKGKVDMIISTNLFHWP